jgi:ribosomal-protein-alanine N-acetyltransferase
LRTVRESDLDTLFALWSDLENRGDYYQIDLPSQVDFKKSFHEHGLMEDKKGTLLICVEDKIVGSISFFSAMYFDGLEIAYILFDKGSRNKGFMTEALSLLVEYLFATKKINRLQLTVFPDNLASKKVAERCGFQFEGVVRGAIFHKGKNHDMQLYSILRTEANVCRAIRKRMLDDRCVLPQLRQGYEDHQGGR